MPLPTNADLIVVRGFWWDESTGQGVASGTVSFDPVPLGNGTGNKTPNLRDLTASGYIKTRKRTATVDPTTGYFATFLVASNDPDLDAYAGRRVTFSGEDPFVVEVPYTAPTVTVDAPMAAATGLTQGSSVKAMWLANLALTTTPTPAPSINYLDSTQTLATIETGIEAHDEDLDAHPDIRAAIADATGAVSSVAGRTGDVTLTKVDVGLNNVDNTSDAVRNTATVSLSNKTIDGGTY